MVEWGYWREEEEEIYLLAITHIWKIPRCEAWFLPEVLMREGIKGEDVGGGGRLSK